MVSLIKTSLLFFLLFNILCITYSMKIWSKIGSSSKKKVPKDPKERCLLVLKKTFKEDSGKDNFLFALFHLNEKSFENDEQGVAKRYFEDMFDTLNNIVTNLPYLWTPREFCHHEYIYQDTKNKCLNIIRANTGCEADLDGADCFKYIYRNWKEYNGALPGTEGISDEDLIIAIRHIYGYRYPEDLPDDKFMDEVDMSFLSTFGLSLLRSERNSGEILCEQNYPVGIPGTTLLDEYERRLSLPEYFCFGKSYRTPFDEVYATYFRNAMRNFGGSAFNDRSDICDSYLSEEQGLNESMNQGINEQMDPHNSDSDD